MNAEWIVGQKVVIKMPETWVNGTEGIYMGEAIAFEDQRGMAGLKTVKWHLVRIEDSKLREVIIICGSHQMIGVEE